jgi:serine protease Do
MDDNNNYNTYADVTYHSVGNTVEPTSKPKKHGHGKIIALALVVSLLGGAAGAGGVLALSNKQSVRSSQILEGTRPSTVIDVATIDTTKQLTPAEVYAQNVASTVGITTSITTNYFGFTTTSAASGSGFIMTADGYILTNYHVIEGSSSIKVTLYDDTSYDAELIGYDESNDIAVLKIDASDLSPVVIGDSDNLNVGDTVLAIGNPLGELTFSLTSGIVSALDRQVTLSSNVTMALIQTDCAINSGNSGGALFNLYGEVVGITNAKYSSSSSSSTASIDNIGFAIPINSVLDIVDSIIENGYISKPYIGVSVQTVSEETQAYGLPQGAAVKSITEGSPAEEAGLQENDIITEANGEAITSSDDLVNMVSDLYSGAELNLTVYRQGETLQITVIVGEKIQSALANEQNQTQQDDSSSSNSQQYQFSFPGGGIFGYRY